MAATIRPGASPCSTVRPFTPATPYSGGVLALTLGQAKTIAMRVALALGALAVAFAWIMKTATQKAASAAILGLLALLVWTQRSSLQECADKVRAEVSANGRNVDTTCDFVGRQITISTGQDD